MNDTIKDHFDYIHDTLNRIIGECSKPMDNPHGLSDQELMYLRHGAEMEVALAGLLSAMKADSPMLIGLRRQDAQDVMDRVEAYRAFHKADGHA